MVKSKKLLSPKLDVNFKRLFGDQRNAELLASMLMAILDVPENEYQSIQIVDPHLTKDGPDDKLGIVDVRVTTASGKVNHIEMQMQDTKNMPERLVYYNSKLLTSQLKANGDYSDLRKTISILIADFSLFKQDDDYHHTFHLKDCAKGVRFTDIVEFHTLELKKLPLNSDGTKKYNWLRFLTATEEEEFEVLSERDENIKKVYAELKQLSEDENAQLIAEAREKALRDERGRLQLAAETGFEQGIEQVVHGLIEQLVPDDVIKKVANLTDEQLIALKGKFEL